MILLSDISADTQKKKRIAQCRLCDFCTNHTECTRSTYKALFPLFFHYLHGTELRGFLFAYVQNQIQDLC